MNEKLRKKKIKKGAFKKLLTSQLLSVVECQTWFLINAKTHHVYQMIQCANNHDSFKNIDENFEKLQEN